MWKGLFPFDVVLSLVCLFKLCFCYLQCSYGHCHSTFHPSCARSAGLFLSMRTNGGKLQHKAYCDKHSLEQRLKVGLVFVSGMMQVSLMTTTCVVYSFCVKCDQSETQRHGVEELKSLKQVRVSDNIHLIIYHVSICSSCLAVQFVSYNIFSFFLFSYFTSMAN